MMDRSWALEDLQLFSPHVYWGLFALENESVWPLQPAVLAAAALAALALARGWRPPSRWLGPALGAAWLWTGWHFVALRYGTVHWIAPPAAWGFYAEAALLAASGLAGRLVLSRRGAAAKAGVALSAAGLLAWPALAPLDGRPWLEAEVFAVAPDPVAVATLGMLALVRSRGWRAALCAAPASWLAFSAFTMLAMGAWQGWAALAAAVAGLAACVLPGRAR